MLRKLRRILCLIPSWIKWQGWAHPFWFVFQPKEYNLTGKQLTDIILTMVPGDILISRTDGVMSTWLIPGWWTHGGVCTSSWSVTHSTAKGVTEDHAFEFLHADYVMVLRPHDYKLAEHGAMVAREIKGAEYDFGFDFEDSSEFACTELVMYCYSSVIKPIRKYFGKPVVIADDIVALSKPLRYEDQATTNFPFYVVYDSRN